MMAKLMLAFKAEILLGARLALRHRTYQVAILFALVVFLLGAIHDLTKPVGTDRDGAVLLVSGILAVIAGSRPLAPGAALASVRHVAAEWWLIPFGRLVGTLLALSPLMIAIVLLFGTSASDSVRVGFVATLYASAVAATMFAMVPVTGTTVGAVLASSAVLVGSIQPSAADVSLWAWPVVRELSMVLWNVLPMPWRAHRLLNDGSAMNALPIVFWLLCGALMAGGITCAYRLGRQPSCKVDAAC